jgi:outer membrane protein assembly factor BamA
MYICAVPNPTPFLKKLLITAVLFLSGILCYATKKDSTHNWHKNSKVDIRLVPVISYAPETRFLVGVGALTPFKCFYDSATKHSIVEAFIAYSQNKQDYIYVPYQIYTKHNNYYFEGEADYYNYSYYYWGIGENRVAKELYDVRFPKIFLNAFRKIVPNFYMGLDYYFEDDVMGATQPGGSLAADTVRGSNGSVTSGGGIDLLYDTRDSIFFPRHGWYIRVTSNFNYKQLGSTYNFDKVVSDISWYHQLARPVVLALTQHNQLNWGDSPFNQLALLGGSKQIRGYYQGYYRDDALSYLQAETRINLIDRVGCVAFGTMAFFGNYHTFPESPIPVFAKGIGLRYNYVRRQHINIRFDVAYGTSVEYYLTVQESF